MGLCSNNMTVIMRNSKIPLQEKESGGEQFYAAPHQCRSSPGSGQMDDGQGCGLWQLNAEDVNKSIFNI